MTSPEDFLRHYGVKGMKWGVRKKRDISSGSSIPEHERKEPVVVLREKLKDGGSLTVYKDPPFPIARFRARHSKKFRESLAKDHSFTLRDKDGKKVGDASFRKDGPTSLNLEWIGVSSQHRGRGHASAALRGVVRYAEENGIDRLTLEVPGASPDALHIYQRLGFQVLDQVAGSSEDDFWDGLTNMELRIPQNSVRHADFDPQEVVNYIVAELNNPDPDDFLAHYGVKGMKWGVRKDRVKKPRSKRPKSSEHEESRRIKKKKLSEMTNEEIATLTRRLQLESQYNRLNPNAYQQGRAAINEITSAINSANTIAGLPSSAIGKAVIAGAGKIKTEW